MDDVHCLIVDDEELMIQRLTMFFDDLSATDSPFRLIGKAFSGQEGLEMAASLKPEIIITDIRMPGMDGIAMIEQMKIILPQAKFIILTAYSDFDYAKRAIQLDVLEYIVKVPLNEADLLRAMEKASSELLTVRSKDERLRSLNMSISENRYRIYKQFFRELFRGQIAATQVNLASVGFDMNIFQVDYCCILIEMNYFVDFINKYPLSEQSILKYGILNVVEETIQLHGKGLAFEIEQHRFIAFVQWSNLFSQMAMEQKYRNVGEAIVSNVSTYLKQSVSVGFSRPHKGWSKVTSAYAQAMETSRLQYYEKPESIITPSVLERTTIAGNAQLLHEQLGELLAMVHREMDFKDIRAKLEIFKDKARKERIQRHELTGWLKKFLRAANIRLSKWNNNLVELDEALLDFMSLDEQMEFLFSHMERYLQVKELPERVEIAKAVSYIEHNLANRLSLQVIAEQVNLAPAYFSSLFKREMKESLVDFINRKKVELAAELIKYNNYTNQELSDKVGIINEAYFCTLFKQKMGETPGQYRKKIGTKQI
ncbi:response regulator transcription factor [Paenibacillus sp. GXUN7292]|uniref:response regulator transcription factor n=1 Tax=Paenibacillus sp. GXUN7292 TaxID=3422499 RepID=UPI003D7C8E59